MVLLPLPPLQAANSMAPEKRAAPKTARETSVSRTINRIMLVSPPDNVSAIARTA
jgi:hypothetical protein